MFAQIIIIFNVGLALGQGNSAEIEVLSHICKYGVLSGGRR